MLCPRLAPTVPGMDSKTVLRYEGNPAIASALGQMLTEEGVEVEWERPVEYRGAAEMAEAVAVYFICAGSSAAIKLAVERFRQRFPDTKVSRSDDQDDDEQR